MIYETDAGKIVQQATQVFYSSDAPQAWQVGPDGAAAIDPFFGLAGHDPSANALNPKLSPHSLEQPPIINLGEVLRFDITPTWVMQRFPRVSTILADTQFDGLRVPLVTGTTPSDLAGTLTYYFDRYQRLQRVNLHAVTGDPTRFANELQQAYKLESEPCLGGGLYVVKWNGRVASLLHVAPAPVIYGDAPYSRYNLFLEINQPGLAYGLSPEAQNLVDAGKHTQRW